MSLRFSSREKKRRGKKGKGKVAYHFQFRVSEKEERDSSFVSPKRVVKASKEDAETTTHTHTHTPTHVCRHQHLCHLDADQKHDESLLVDEKTPPKALVFETTTPFFCVRIVFKIDAKTTGKGRP